MESRGAGGQQPAIEFAGVGFRRGPATVLEGLDLSVATGQTLVLLGRSGSGKTTALKLINRLLMPTAGEVRVEGRATSSWDAIRLRRRIGYAIQEVGLFPHYTAEQNIAVLPRAEGWPRERARQRAHELLAMVGLPPAEFAGRYPAQLSGGQRQRVGWARALALDPPLLLMDEPFGALDPLTRAELQREFRKLGKSLGKTVVFVTHDTREALLVGDAIALLDAGKLQGQFTPQQFVASPEAAVQPYLAALRVETL